MRDRFVRADEARAELDAGRAHLQIAGDRLAPADAAGDEHGQHVGDLGQHLLREHAGGDRADMAAGLHPLDHQRIDAGADQLLREASVGGEADHLGARRLDPLDRAAGRQPAGEHDMADVVAGADLDQLDQGGMHRDEVDAERLGRERLGRGDLGIEQVGRHRPARDHAEAAGVRDRRDEVALADPRHRAGQDRDDRRRGIRRRAPSARRAGRGWRSCRAASAAGASSARPARRRCAARAPPARYNPRGSAR